MLLIISIARQDERIRRAVKKWLNVVGLLVLNSAKRRILRGPNSGEVYEKYNPRRTHQASAPGESPASDTGTLVRGVVMQVDEAAHEVNVGTNVQHGKWTELGTRNMEARPWLAPALKTNKRKFVPLLKAILGQEP